MQPQTITLPEVTAFAQKGRFFRQGDADFIEISFVGSKDTVVRKVKPEHMALFREEWNAFCDGRPAERRQGTPLTDVGMPSERAEEFVYRNVHTLEELAMLSDAQCQGLGHGTLTYRENGRKLLQARALQRAARDRDAVSEGAATLTSAVEAKVEQSTGEIAELKAQVSDLTKAVGALLAAMQPAEAKRGPGRPKKAVAEVTGEAVTVEVSSDDAEH